MIHFPYCVLVHDLTKAANGLSMFIKNPGVAHWEQVKRVLRYLSGTVGEEFLYKRGAQFEVWHDFRL